MKLLQAKLRGLGTTMETRWFDLSPKLNLFHFPEKEAGRCFFQGLQTIKPPYSCHAVKPFANFPGIITQGKHTKRVNPTKRTIALSVFSATPELVNELAAISPLLWETDRIEVGRRLDYSRWINFVELASSTRWSETSADIQELLEQCNLLTPNPADTISGLISNLKPSDRIKGEIKDKLAAWLYSLPEKLGPHSEQLIETTLEAINRVDHFQIARDLVATRLPLFTLLDISGAPRSSSNIVKKITEKAGSELSILGELNKQLLTLSFSGTALQFDNSEKPILFRFVSEDEKNPLTEPLTNFKQLQAETCLAIAFSRVAYGSEPILLFNFPERDIPHELHQELADFIIQISTHCQCLYNYASVDIFPTGIAGRRYSGAELDMAA